MSRYRFLRNKSLNVAETLDFFMDEMAKIEEEVKDIFVSVGHAKKFQKSS